MNFNLGNAVKYIWRCDLKKDDIEDLKKARHYIYREIERRNTARHVKEKHGEARVKLKLKRKLKMKQESKEKQTDKARSLQRLVMPRQTSVSECCREDCEAMRRALNSAGYDADLYEIELAWGEYSESEHCASWLSMRNYESAHCAKALLRVMKPAMPNGKLSDAPKARCPMANTNAPEGAFASVPGYARFGLPRSVLVHLSAAVEATQTIRYCRSQGYRIAEIMWLDAREHMRRSARQELAAHNGKLSDAPAVGRLKTKRRLKNETKRRK